MTYIKPRRNNNKLLTVKKNYFTDGGKTDNGPNTGASNNVGISDIASAVAGIGSILGNTNNSSIESNYRAFTPKTVGIEKNDSFDKLSDDISNYADQRALTRKDFRDSSNDVMGVISESMQGASAGAAAGPWGALAGGVAGLGKGLANVFIGNKKAKRMAREANKHITYANDFNKRSFTNRADNLIDEQADALSANYIALGGNLGTHGANFTNGLNEIVNGGTHEENPYEGVPMGMDNKGVPNRVEEGETIFNDNVFSNRLTIDNAFASKYKLPKNITYADASKRMAKESEERPNDPISQRGLKSFMNELFNNQEEQKVMKNMSLFKNGGRLNKFVDGGNDVFGVEVPAWAKDSDTYTPFPSMDAPKPYRGTKYPYAIAGNPNNIKYPGITLPEFEITPPNTKATIPSNPTIKPLPKNSKKPKWLDWMSKNLTLDKLRYAPIVAGGISAINSLAAKPDYSDADAIAEAAKTAGQYDPIEYNPIGNYMSYEPMDTDRPLNNLNASSAATRRAILQNSGLNRGAATAGILSADYNYNMGVGELARQAAESNLAQKRQVEEFNRATNMANSQGKLEADRANQAAKMNLGEFNFKAALAAAEARQRERLALDSLRSADLSGFFQGLGDVGRETADRNMINTMRSLYYGVGADGKSYYKKAFTDLSEEERENIKKQIGDKDR